MTFWTGGGKKGRKHLKAKALNFSRRGGLPPVITGRDQQKKEKESASGSVRTTLRPAIRGGGREKVWS